MKIFNNCFVVLVSAILATAHSRVPDNLKMIGKTIEKKYYISQNSANFSAARKNCHTINGGRLATIESLEDLDAIIENIDGYPMNKVWVGGKVSQSSLCASATVFRGECWVWEEIEDKIDPDIIMWDTSTTNRPQSPNDHAYLNLLSIVLDYEKYYFENRYLCEAVS